MAFYRVTVAIIYLLDSICGESKSQTVVLCMLLVEKKGTWIKKNPSQWGQLKVKYWKS